MVTLDNDFFSTPTSRNYMSYLGSDHLSPHIPWIDYGPWCSTDRFGNKGSEGLATRLLIIKNSKKCYINGSYVWGCFHQGRCEGVQNDIGFYWANRTSPYKYGADSYLGYRGKYYSGEPNNYINGFAFKEGYYMDLAMSAVMPGRFYPGLSGGSFNRAVYNTFLYTPCGTSLARIDNPSAKMMIWCASNSVHEGYSDDVAIMPPSAYEIIGRGLNASPGVGAAYAGTGPFYNMAKVVGYVDGHVKYFRGSVWDWCAQLYIPNAV